MPNRAIKWLSYHFQECYASVCLAYRLNLNTVLSTIDLLGLGLDWQEAVVTDWLWTENGQVKCWAMEYYKMIMPYHDHLPGFGCVQHVTAYHPGRPVVHAGGTHV